MAGISTAHDTPPPELICHLSWLFLAPADRSSLCQAFRIVGTYAKLRYHAVCRPLSYWDYLHSMGPISEAPSSLSRSRAYDLAAALLLLDFQVGDLIRWLGGDYAHDHIPMAPIEEAVAAIRSRPRPPGYPVVDYDRALHVLRHGAPLTADYVCRRADLLRRNLYNNHGGATKAAAAVMKKIVGGCNNHFLLVLPRWVLRFLYGLFLSPIGFVERKDKGRVVVDPSAHVADDTDTGALNDCMHKSDPVQCPPTFYASAQRRHWTHIWNLRVTHPREEIVLYKDDINAAFHRGRYHPDAASAYSYVWLEWLIIHVGLIFGGRNSPGWFCQLSELRAAIAMYYDGLRSDPLYPLVRRIAFPSPPPAEIAASFGQAVADDINPGTAPDLSCPTHHATFVDDNLMAEILPRVTTSVQRSTASCYLLFGHPQPLRREIREGSHMDDGASWSADRYAPDGCHLPRV